MPSIEEIASLRNGSRFYRADLHIHSHGGSYDVNDTTMTPERIVSLAVEEQLSLIAITDHNEIRCVPTAIKEAASKNLLVIPGVELSTPQGHLLCYTETYDDLERFFGRLNIADRGSRDSRCKDSMFECLEKLQECGGFAVLAHVDGPKGYDVEVPGLPPHKLDVLCHKALLGIELRSAQSDISYSDSDPEVERKQVGQERIQRLGIGRRQFLARILNSDAHTLEALGRNAAGDRKVTRYKMQSPSFVSLRIALQDADARVRIEDEIPDSIPFVIGAHFSGGFLNGQSFHFNSNLNCIIGGRGTGKSTAFEAIRCLCTPNNDSSVVDSEIWPSGLYIYFQDQAGQRHSIYRASGSDFENLDDPTFGPTAFEVECFGQGEAQRISKEAHKDPGSLLKYLDSFIEIRSHLDEERKLVAELEGVQSEIEKAEKNVAKIPEYEKSLAIVKQQLSELEKAKASDIIKLQRNIEEERELRKQIQLAIMSAQSLAKSQIRDELTRIYSYGNSAELKVGPAEYSAISEKAKEAHDIVQSAEASVDASLKALAKSIEEHLAAWK